MSNDKKKQTKKPSLQTVKPKQPNTEGAPNDQDPNAQYEDKDES
jgi:hypothetical protein